MVAAIQELSKEPNHENVKPAASIHEACNLLFEKGLLSNRRINSLHSPVIENIKKGMAFFKKWCHSHEKTGNFWHSVLDLLMLYLILISYICYGSILFFFLGMVLYDNE